MEETDGQVRLREHNLEKMRYGVSSILALTLSLLPELLKGEGRVRVRLATEVFGVTGHVNPPNED
jgi:hypothetical protein